VSREAEPRHDHLVDIQRFTTAALNPYEVDHLLRTYLEPPGFAAAVRRLARTHLLVLAGAEAAGKRLGAIALLSRMSLAEGSVTVLSPGVTVADLAARMDFDPGRAYLLPDWTGDPAGRRDLISLARDLAEVGSFLVMTRTGPLTSAVEVEHPWTPPPAADLFELRLAASGGTAHRDGRELAEARKIAADLPSPAEVVALADQFTGPG